MNSRIPLITSLSQNKEQIFYIIRKIDIAKALCKCAFSFVTIVTA